MYIKLFLVSLICISCVEGSINIDNIVLIQPTCSGQLGYYGFDVWGNIGPITITWTPDQGNVTSAYLLPGSYNIEVTDGVFYNTLNPIIDPAPQGIIFTDSGNYWNTHNNRDNYLARSCSYSVNPDLIGFAGYGSWNPNNEIGRIATGGVGVLSYLWTSNGGTFNDATLTTPVFYPNVSATPIDLILTVTDSNGCTNETIIPFILSYLDPVITTTASSITQGNGELTLNFNGRIDIPTYVSSIITNLDTNVIYNVSGSDLMTLTGLSAGNYQLTYDYDDVPLCSSVYNFVIDSCSPNTKVNIIDNVVDYCNFNLNILGANDDTIYTWSTNDNNVILHRSDTVKPIIETLLDSVILSLTMETYGCTANKDIIVNFNNVLTLPDVTIINSTCSQMIGQILINASVCHWTDITSTSCTRTALAGGIYSLLFTDSCERLHRISHLVPISDCILPVPTTTPTMTTTPTTTTIVSHIEISDIVINSTVYVNLTNAPINVVFTFNETNSTHIGIQQGPLLELANDTIVQGLNLSSVLWTNTLFNLSGYQLLISSGSSPLDFSITTINVTHMVNIIYYQYFFQHNCRRAFANYTVDSIECGNFTEDVNNTAYEYYEAGDTKLAYSITNWPFLNLSNILQTEIVYTDSIENITQINTTTTMTQYIVDYSTSSNLILRTTFLRQSMNDGQLRDIELQAGTDGRVRIRFPAFSESLFYDPSLMFLLSSASDLYNENRSTPNIIMHVVPIGVCIVFATLVIILSYAFDFIGRFTLGPEAVRVNKLRSVKSKFTTEEV